MSWISIDYKNKNTFNPDQSQLIFAIFFIKMKNYTQADHIFAKNSQMARPEQPQKSLYIKQKVPLLPQVGRSTQYFKKFLKNIKKQLKTVTVFSKFKKNVYCFAYL